MLWRHEILDWQLIPFGDGQESGPHSRQPGGRARILGGPKPRLGRPVVGNVYGWQGILWQPCCAVERLQPAGLGSPSLTARERGDGAQRCAIRMLMGSQLGDGDIRQDLARRPIQLPGDRVTGLPQLGDVGEAATAVHVMDTGGAPPGIPSRFRTDPSAGY